MSHKAYSLDWMGFETQLRPLIQAALSSNDDSALRRFISRNQCSDPSEGAKLDESWAEQFPSQSVQALSDLALTAFYQPLADFGLGNEWQSANATLSGEVRAALLGSSLSDHGTEFDPGLMGSYFQSPVQVQRSFALLAEAGMLGESAFLAGLAEAAKNGKGLYVTF